MFVIEKLNIYWSKLTNIFYWEWKTTEISGKPPIIIIRFAKKVWQIF